MVYKRETEFFTPSLAVDSKAAVVKYSLTAAVRVSLIFKNTIPMQS